jgi:hypothetical protein
MEPHIKANFQRQQPLFMTVDEDTQTQTQTPLYNDDDVIINFPRQRGMALERVSRSRMQNLTMKVNGPVPLNLPESFNVYLVCCSGAGVAKLQKEAPPVQ